MIWKLMATRRKEMSTEEPKSILVHHSKEMLSISTVDIYSRILASGNIEFEFENVFGTSKIEYLTAVIKL